MDKGLNSTPPEAPGVPHKKVINAKEFAAAFQQRPDDFYLMDKFALTTTQLKRIYTALMEKGVLSEYEYNQREGKTPELEEWQPPQLSASAAVTLVETPSEALTERIKESGYSFDTGLRQAVSQAIEDKKRRVPRHTESSKDETSDFCPSCRKPKDPSSPQECRYCGVVFQKIESEKEKGGFSVWADD